MIRTEFEQKLERLFIGMGMKISHKSRHDLIGGRKGNRVESLLSGKAYDQVASDSLGMAANSRYFCAVRGFDAEDKCFVYRHRLYIYTGSQKMDPLDDAAREMLTDELVKDDSYGEAFWGGWRDESHPILFSASMDHTNKYLDLMTGGFEKQDVLRDDSIDFIVNLTERIVRRLRKDDTYTS